MPTTRRQSERVPSLEELAKANTNKHEIDFARRPDVPLQIPFSPEELDTADAALSGRPTLAEQLGSSKEAYAAVDAAIDDQRWEQPGIESDPVLIRINERIDLNSKLQGGRLVARETKPEDSAVTPSAAGVGPSNSSELSKEARLALGGWAEKLLEEACRFARLVRGGRPPENLRAELGTLFTDVIDKLQKPKRGHLFETAQRQFMKVPDLMVLLADVKQLRGSTLADYRKEYRRATGTARKRRLMPQK